MIKIFRLLTYLLILSLLTSCTHIFELDSDVQARQALFDLMKVQEKFYKDNNRYAGKLLAIEKYDFKYHTGIADMRYM